MLVAEKPTIQIPERLRGLNHSQQRAVLHNQGPLLTVAGAGSGKTRALTFRIAELLMNRVSAASILGVTFTNKAANEMKERLRKLLCEQLQATTEEIDLIYMDHLTMGTFHSFCVKLLRQDVYRYNGERGRRWSLSFGICDQSDARRFIEEAAKELDISKEVIAPGALQGLISRAKNEGLTPLEYQKANDDEVSELVFQVYDLYQNYLEAANSLDFDDLIFVSVRLLQQCPEIRQQWHDTFKHILIDEYQDTNGVQYELIKLLSVNGQEPQQFDWTGRSLFLVGDTDQSIYSFRCADYTIMMAFQSDFGDGLERDETQTLLFLEENYRSTEKILQAANAVIANNTARIEKVLKPTRDNGERLRFCKLDSDYEEADFVVQSIQQMQAVSGDWGQFAVLYRTNSQSRLIEKALVKANIPYDLIGGLRFYARAEIKDLIAYLKVLVNPKDLGSLTRIINRPARKIGKKTITKLRIAAGSSNVSMWDLMTNDEKVKETLGSASGKVLKFRDMMAGFMEQMDQISVPELMSKILLESGYSDYLNELDEDEAFAKLGNVDQLLLTIEEHCKESDDATVQGFLDNAVLESQRDKETPDGAVTLMSVHGSKGLEFPVVFLTGMEDGLFPSSKAVTDEEIEEERRLFYVGMTRAMNKLYLTRAERRSKFGSVSSTEASPFLYEIPRELITLV